MAPKRKSKREPETFCASHKQIYELVRERQILTDYELWDLAQNLSTEGDFSVSNYCTGSSGIMKRNLQASIDVIWRDEASAETATHGPDAAHCRELSVKQLVALKKRARNPVLVARPKALGLVVQNKPSSSLRSIRDTSSGTKTPSSGKAVLFDHLGHRAEIIFRPRCGIWRLRDFYELLIACQEETDLQGAQPSPSAEGGFRFPREESGWHAMLRADVATPRVQFCELSRDQKVAAAPEIRLGCACGSLCWNPAGPKAYEEWVEELPKDESFDKDTLLNVAPEERLVRLWSKNHVEDRHWRGLLQVLEACEHSVRQTTGFALAKGVMKITGSAARSTQHKHGGTKRTTFGIEAAQAAVEEESRNGYAAPRAAAACLMMGESRSAHQCPEVAPKAKTARLSSIRDQPRLASISRC